MIAIILDYSYLILVVNSTIWVLWYNCLRIYSIIKELVYEHSFLGLFGGSVIVDLISFFFFLGIYWYPYVFSPQQPISITVFNYWNNLSRSYFKQVIKGKKKNSFTLMFLKHFSKKKLQQSFFLETFFFNYLNGKSLSKFFWII